MPKLHLQSYGAHHAQTIVLLHGWAMHSGVWQHFAETLAQDYRVICVDLPGHGHSLPLQPFTLDNLARHIMQAVTVDAAYWVGWSLGGLVATTVATQFPKQVKGLVLLASNPCFVKQANWPGMRAQVLHNFAQELIQQPEATLLRFLALQLHGVAGHSRLLASLRQQVLRCAPPNAEVLQAGLGLLQHSDLRAQLAALTLPKFALLGAKDALVPVALAEAMHELKVATQIIAQAGHAPFLSHPQDCLDALRNWLVADASA